MNGNLTTLGQWDKVRLINGGGEGGDGNANTAEPLLACVQ